MITDSRRDSKQSFADERGKIWVVDAHSIYFFFFFFYTLIDYYHLSLKSPHNIFLIRSTAPNLNSPPYLSTCITAVSPA